MSWYRTRKRHKRRGKEQRHVASVDMTWKRKSVTASRNLARRAPQNASHQLKAKIKRDNGATYRKKLASVTLCNNGGSSVTHGLPLGQLSVCAGIRLKSCAQRERKTGTSISISCLVCIKCCALSCVSVGISVGWTRGRGGTASAYSVAARNHQYLQAFR